jgi:hypothetical protein
MTMSDLFPEGSRRESRAVVKPVAPQPKETAAPRRGVTPRPLGELLDAVCATLRRYVVFPLQEQATVIAVWIVHAWLFRAADYTPYLFIFSASKRSGKTRVLEILELLCPNAELTPGASAAALIRSGDEEKPPTLLLDEMDTVYGKKADAEAENTRRFLNAGYKRGARFMKCVGQGADIQVKKFPAFCPKALAGIDRCLPDTVLDRSLPIALVRQARKERAERLRDREARAATSPLRAELEVLAEQPDLIEVLRSARPAMPDELHDRAQDITEPLTAIGDLAGGVWPGKIRGALIRLYGEEEDADLGVKLLSAIKRVFDETGADNKPTIDILQGIIAIEDDAPWALWYEDDLKHGRLKKAGSHLARKLKRYGIKPSKIRFGDETAQGYHKTDFREAWERYLTASIPPSETNGTNGTDGPYSSFTWANDVPTSIPLTQNVLSPAAGERNIKCEGKAQDVPSVPSVPSNLDKGHKWGDCLTCTDERWHLCDACEAEFNAGKTMYPIDFPEWVRLYGEETSPHWQDALKQGLVKACEVCEERLTQEPYIWFHLANGVGQCANCRESQWWSDGYEIDEFGFPSCWNHEHTREERIAERERHYKEIRVRELRWLQTPKGQQWLEQTNREFTEQLKAKGLTLAQFYGEADEEAIEV